MRERTGGMEFPSTPPCEMFGIEIPVMQAGMSLVATPELAAAVSNAGALGVLGSGMYRGDSEDLWQSIAVVRKLTDRPFGVDIGFASAHLDPDPLLQRVEEMLSSHRKSASRVLENLTPGNQTGLSRFASPLGLQR
jgi:NAD(P)H-dependent flavin oxidoreductase YrpB (nitropropane dioxygenase family)